MQLLTTAAAPQTQAQHNVQLLQQQQQLVDIQRQQEQHTHALMAQLAQQQNQTGALQQQQGQQQQLLQQLAQNTSTTTSHPTPALATTTTNDPTSDPTGIDPSTDRLLNNFSLKAKAPPWLAKAIRTKDTILRRRSQAAAPTQTQGEKEEDFQTTAAGNWPNATRRPRPTDMPEHGTIIPAAALAQINAHPLVLTGRTIAQGLDDIAQGRSY